MLNRNFCLILCANIILGCAMPMLIIVGGLSGIYLAPLEAMATLPPTMQVLASILFSIPISLLMGKFGRQFGFILGGLILLCGGALGYWAMLKASFILLCLSHFILGIALGCFNYFRFAASESVEEKHKPNALSWLLASGLVAAFLAPELFALSKDWFAPIPLAGAYLGIAILAVVGVFPIIWLRLENLSQPDKQQFFDRDLWRVLLKFNVLIAVLVGVIAQSTMMFMMVATPIAMIGCGFAEGQAADVIRWHVVAMFAPGFFTGFLIKKIGLNKTVLLGMGFLITAGILASLNLDIMMFYGALICLGIGWNFSFIGATHMLQQSLQEDEKSFILGMNEMIIAITACIASFASGALLIYGGWFSIACILIAIVLMFLIVWYFIKRFAHANNSFPT